MKKILLATFLFVFATSTNALAHTHIESTSPEDGELVTEELREITLNFEGKIEENSSFELNNGEGQSIPVENISVNEGVMTGTIAKPLENGEYQVKWSIIGADGHVMEGDYSFTVQLPEPTSSGEDSNETNQEDQSTTQNLNVQSTSDQVEETDTNGETPLLVPVIIIILVIIVIVGFIAMGRKK
ncbi:MAG TPA: copper resistance protein CopC [Ureibacillus sp.]|nr:copper resistance protein CopC [Ureibacillus sp.]